VGFKFQFDGRKLARIATVDNGKNTDDVIETVLRGAEKLIFVQHVVYLKHVDAQENEPKVKDGLDENAEENRHDVHLGKRRNSLFFFVEET
jgi:hypothetical protein